MILDALCLLALPILAGLAPSDDGPSVNATTATVVDSLPRRGALGVAFSAVPPDQAVVNGLKSGEGVLVVNPIPGLTGAKAGLRAGDVLLALNETNIALATVGATVRALPSGRPLTFRVIRDGKPIELVSPLMEKPRDPGNDRYEVRYEHVVSNGKKMRTIVTVPRSSGRHSALLFIQGFSPVSYDFTLEGSKGDVASLDGPILFEFANRDFVTMRVEKPGVGDSEGGPFAELDYTTELDIYRQALKQLKSMNEVDADNVFIFGHSMGGAFGPMVACEVPVKGIAVYGTAARTWHEYLLDTLRYQGLVAGGTYAQADESVRLGGRLFALLFHEDKTVDQVKKDHPELAMITDELMPDGLFNGKTLAFWNQLGKTNFADYWARCGTRVLAVHGASDYVSYEVDHRLIADIVNREHPGWGTFKIAPSSDHLFHDFATEPESLRGQQRGRFNPAFTQMMMSWVEQVISEKG